MRKISLLVLSSLIISSPVLAQVQLLNSTNGNTKISTINNQVPSVLPPGVKMYGVDYAKEIDDSNVIQPGVNMGQTQEVEMDINEEINTIRGGIIPAIDTKLMNPVNAQQTNLQNQNQNNNTINLAEPRKTGQVPIKIVITPLNSIGDFNKSTIDEFTEIGNKRLEQSYKQFLMK